MTADGYLRSGQRCVVPANDQAEVSTPDLWTHRTAFTGRRRHGTTARNGGRRRHRSGQVRRRLRPRLSPAEPSGQQRTAHQAGEREHLAPAVLGRGGHGGGIGASRRVERCPARIVQRLRRRGRRRPQSGLGGRIPLEASRRGLWLSACELEGANPDCNCACRGLLACCVRCEARTQSANSAAGSVAAAAQAVWLLPPVISCVLTMQCAAASPATATAASAAASILAAAGSAAAAPARHSDTSALNAAVGPAAAVVRGLGSSIPAPAVPTAGPCGLRPAQGVAGGLGQGRAGGCGSMAESGVRSRASYRLVREARYVGRSARKACAEVVGW